MCHLQCLVKIVCLFHAHLFGLLTIELADQNDAPAACFAQGRPSGLTVDLITVAQRFFESIELFVIEPVKKSGVAEAVRAGSQQDDCSTRANGLHTVIKGFVGLNEVDVLGFAAAGDDGQVSGLLEWCSVKPLRQFAACQVGLLQIAAEDFSDFLVSRQDGIE